GSERGPHLPSRQSVGQRAPKGRVREEVERAAPVRERAPERWKGSVGTDQALLNRRVAPRAQRRARREILPRRRLAGAGVEDREQHRMDDEAVVVVPMELGTIPIGAVALVPLLVLPQRVVDAQAI